MGPCQGWWDTVSPPGDIPCDGEMRRASSVLLAGTFAPALCVVARPSIIIRHPGRKRRVAGREEGRKEGQPGPALAEHLCPSSAPSSTTCWRSASTRSSAAISSRSRRRSATWTKVGVGFRGGGGGHPPGLAGTLRHHPSSSFLLLPRAIQAAERPHRADGHRVAARPARHSGSETAAGAVGEKKGPRINLGCSGVAHALTELPPTCMTTRQPLELRRGQPVEVGAQTAPVPRRSLPRLFSEQADPRSGVFVG